MQLFSKKNSKHLTGVEMSRDSFDELLNLEDSYYQEGYDLGQADGAHAGLVEGKLFGVEKGFEKAVSMGRLSGRAEVWQRRFQPSATPSSQPAQARSLSNEIAVVPSVQIGSTSHTGIVTSAGQLPALSTNARLGRHIGYLSATTDSASLSSKNSDEAVADFDERLTKATAKAKVITNIIAEPLQIEDAANHGHGSIEESGSLSARH